MNIPLFTAEASLYKTGERYRSTAAWVESAVPPELIPQQYWRPDWQGAAAMADTDTDPCEAARRCCAQTGGKYCCEKADHWCKADGGSYYAVISFELL
jgi:hypothetical protein